MLVRIETVLAADGLALDDLAMPMIPPALPPGRLHDDERHGSCGATA